MRLGCEVHLRMDKVAASPVHARKLALNMEEDIGMIPPSFMISIITHGGGVMDEGLWE